MNYLVAVFAVLPSLATATPIYIDYQGTVNQFDGRQALPGYEPGQRIEGRLIVDTSMAPPKESVRAWDGFYGYVGVDPHPDFVKGFVDASPAGGGDIIHVTNNELGTEMDRYIVSDRTPDGRGLMFVLDAAMNGLLSSTDIMQSFHVTSAEAEAAGGSIGGYIMTNFDNAISFSLDWLSVRPAACSAPRDY